MSLGYRALADGRTVFEKDGAYFACTFEQLLQFEALISEIKNARLGTVPIATESEYRAALREIGALMQADPAPGTPAGVQLAALATRIEAYERLHYPLDA